MIKQTPISFKIDSDMKDNLDATIAELHVNRNKFINYCVRFALDVVKMQLDVAKTHHLDCQNLSFLSDLH